MKIEALESIRAIAAEHPLTDVEVATVKECYSKMLTRHDLAMEYLAERFFFLYPEMAAQFGPAADTFQDQIAAALGDCMSALLPQLNDIGCYTSSTLSEGSSARRWSALSDRDHFQVLAELGLQERHWEALRVLWIEALLHEQPRRREDQNRRDTPTPEYSALYRFFVLVVMERAYSAIKDVSDIFDAPQHAQILKESWELFEAGKEQMAAAFYTSMLERHPELIPRISQSDMGAIGSQWASALQAVAQAVPHFETVIPTLHRVGRQHVQLGIPSYAHDTMYEELQSMFAMHMPFYAGSSPESRKLRHLWEAVFGRACYVVVLATLNAESVLVKAFDWLELVSKEKKWNGDALERRKQAIRREVLARGTYTHTKEELMQGARVAWRNFNFNSAKCSSQAAWGSVLVRDRRDIVDPDEMMAECLEHQRLATADGSPKPIVTVFRPLRPLERIGPRFWNAQLIRFACYELPDGTTMGDRANRELTEALISFGWQPPEPRGEFDVLPIVIETPGQGAGMYHVPEEYVRTVVLEHPQFPDVAKLNLKWCVVPTFTGFTMEVGGVKYSAVPLSGLYTDIEATRDLVDCQRYDKGVDLGKAMGFDIDSTTNFWRDKVALELNIAAAHSLRQNGYNAAGHQTAAQQFNSNSSRGEPAARPLSATMGHSAHELGRNHGSAQYSWHGDIWDMMRATPLSADEADVV
eukprot:TRINITY_DN13941_c0_g1_i1.p1 TRINITY_DN13941_c0_g1~~TRINITY_DN13941_c0_g1_i1.p1  ORF type:complete len:697 (-),score=187.85 TRINITY_DN13941_c0_g1_i1:427-2517(-)